MIRILDVNRWSPLDGIQKKSRGKICAKDVS